MIYDKDTKNNSREIVRSFLSLGRAKEVLREIAAERIWDFDKFGEDTIEFCVEKEQEFKYGSHILGIEKMDQRLLSNIEESYFKHVGFCSIKIDGYEHTLYILDFTDTLDNNSQVFLFDYSQFKGANRFLLNIQWDSNMAQEPRSEHLFIIKKVLEKELHLKGLDKYVG